MTPHYGFILGFRHPSEYIAGPRNLWQDQTINAAFPDRHVLASEESIDVTRSAIYDCDGTGRGMS
jgi:hypothetical protein